MRTRSSRFLVPALVVALVAPAVASVPRAGAADAVECSAEALIQAIRNANADTDHTVITLAQGCVYNLTGGVDGWYGLNGLPAIGSPITIEGNGATIQRDAGAAHFRFFFVGADPAGSYHGDFVSPGPGDLTLRDLTLRGGYARGGNSGRGGGGGGMGGAIFSQGKVTLERVTIAESTAEGGSTVVPGDAHGAGMVGGLGIGFAPQFFEQGYSGPAGGSRAPIGGGGGGAGGGGGFWTTAKGKDGNGTDGGDGGGVSDSATPFQWEGFGGAGGFQDCCLDADGGQGGSGGGGGAGGSVYVGTGFGGDGAEYGKGAISSSNPGGGGGVGGGGARGGDFAGGGGGFGGGGGAGGPASGSNARMTGGQGGFGGGGGGTPTRGTPWAGGPGGWGGGDGGQIPASSDFAAVGGGGAGLGGAIFNMAGELHVTSSTLAGNAAIGGTAAAGSTATEGSGFGGAIFNLEGQRFSGREVLTLITNTTIAGNEADEGAALYQVRTRLHAVNGSDPYQGGTDTAIKGSVLASSTPAVNALFVGAPGRGLPVNNDEGYRRQLGDYSTRLVSLGTVDLTGGFNLIQSMGLGNNDSRTRILGTEGTHFVTGDPKLGPLQDNGGPTHTMAPLHDSPLIDQGHSNGLTTDQRGRPLKLDLFPANATNGDASDIGAVEADIHPLPGPAKPLAPGGANVNPIDFSWEPGFGSTFYYLWVNKAGTSSNVFKKWYTAEEAGCAEGGECKIVAPVQLIAADYTWWVQTWNPNGYGKWSFGKDFAVSVPVKTLLGLPQPGAEVENPVTFGWLAVDRATWYYLWVNRGGTNVLKQWYRAEEAALGSAKCDPTQFVPGNLCAVRPAITLPAGDYTWWVQTYGQEGYGPWSASSTFTVPLPGKATNLQLTGALPNDESWHVSIRWDSSVPKSTWYYIWVNRGSANVIKRWVKAEDVGCPSGGACNTTINVTGAGSYKWWIQTWSPAGYGPWSDAAIFEITSLE